MALALTTRDPFSIITLPGGDGAGPPAWDRLLAWPARGDAELPFTATSAAQRNLWAARLDEAVAQADRAVLLVAQGASCAAAAWWARLSPSQYVDRVAGAFLFMPDGGQGRDTLFASPAAALPFPSVVVTEREGEDTMASFARSCGSRLLAVSHAAGPRQPTMWRQAQRMIERVAAGIVEYDMRVIHAFAPPER